MVKLNSRAGVLVGSLTRTAEADRSGASMRYMLLGSSALIASGLLMSGSPAFAVACPAVSGGMIIVGSQQVTTTCTIGINDDGGPTVPPGIAVNGTGSVQVTGADGIDVLSGQKALSVLNNRQITSDRNAIQISGRLQGNIDNRGTIASTGISGGTTYEGIKLVNAIIEGGINNYIGARITAIGGNAIHATASQLGFGQVTSIYNEVGAEISARSGYAAILIDGQSKVFASAVDGNSIINDGHIGIAAGQSGAGLKILDQTQVLGNIRNSGTIDAIGNYSALTMDRGVIVGGNLINAGLIDASQAVNAIELTDGDATLRLSSSIASIRNDSAGTINASFTGILVRGSSVTGGIRNDGRINADFGIYLVGGADIGIDGIVNDTGAAINANQAIVMSGSQIQGSIINRGQINATSAGLEMFPGSMIVGNIENSGTITAPQDAIFFNTSTLTGVITNSGTIAVTDSAATVDQGNAINLSNSSMGGLNNSLGGLISSVNGNTVYASNAAIVGGISNSGTITAATASAIYLSDTASSITNDGTISGTGLTASYGISVTGSAANITNNGMISGTTGAIDLSGAFADSLTLGAASTTSGGIALGDGNDAFTLNTGAIVTGRIDGGTGIDSFTAQGSGATTLAGHVTGFESLAKNGTGTLMLSGTNDAFGTLAINGGTLIASGGAAIADTDALTIASSGTFTLASSETIGSLAGAGAVSLGANNLTFGDGTNTVYSGVASGTGGLIKVGTGEFTISGANTYTGATDILAGTLRLGANDVLSDATALTIGSGATLDLNGFNDTVGSFTLSGSLIGSGVLTSNGANLNGGMLANQLSSVTVNQTTGTTLVMATIDANNVNVTGGRLQLGASDRMSNRTSLTINPAGTLDLQGFNDTVNSLVSAGTINGMGVLTAATYDLQGGVVNANLGAGTLTNTSGTSTLNGISTASVVNITGGTLALGATQRLANTAAVTVAPGGVLDLAVFEQVVGSLAGTGGTVALGSGRLTVNQDTATDYAGAITGVGGLTKSGAGRLNLTGANSYTGATLVTNGILSVNGSLAAAVTVSDSGRIGGNGRIGTLTLTPGGTLAPGNSIGTLNVTGNLFFQSGAIYEVETTPIAADRTNVTGTATLSGGTVRVLADGTEYGPLTRFTIISATGGVTGTFASVTSTLAFLNPTLEYSSNAVTLTLHRNNTAFTAIAQTHNQIGVATALQSLAATATLPAALLSADAAGARASLDALSGESYAAVPSALIDEGRYVREALLLDGERTGDGFGIWGDAIDNSGKFDRRVSSGTAALTNHRRGIITGFDYGRDGFHASLATGYSDATYSVVTRGSSAHVESYYAGGQLSYRTGRLRLQAGSAYTWHSVTTQRTVSLTGYQDNLRSQQNGYTVQGFGELGYAVIDTATFKLEPFLGYTHLYSSVDPTVESGRAAALAVAGVRRRLDFARAGLHLTGSVPLNDTGALFRPRLSVAYQRGGGDRTGKAMVALDGAAPFQVIGAALPRNSAQINSGFDFSTGTVRIGASYAGTIGDDQFDHGVKITFGIQL